MVNTLLGIKKQMTSTHDSRGRRVGATVVEIEPNWVTQIKGEGESGKEKDGYNAIQLGYGTKKSVRKPQIGHAKAAGIETPIRWFREVRISNQAMQQSSNADNETALLHSSIANDLKPGQAVNLAQVFSIGDSVRVTGTSKGKGFQGGVRRHGFHGGPKTHGQSDRHRAPGSIGAGTTPGRVYKGKKMAGHMGNVTASTSGLEVVGVDKQNNLLIIKGAVPGSTGGLIMITKLGSIRGYTPPPPSSAEATEGKEEKPEESHSVPTNVGTPRDKEEFANTSEVKSAVSGQVDTSEVGQAAEKGEETENAS